VNLEALGEYAEGLAAELRGRLFRAEVDLGPDSFNKKIRQAATAKIPNVLIVGGREQETRSVTWRRYGHEEQRNLPFDEFVALLEKMRQDRTMDNFPDVELPSI